MAPLSFSHALTGACAVSDRVVAALREPAAELGLTWEEHCVMLLLWTTDGRTEARIAELLAVSPACVAPTFQSLQEKAFVECDRGEGTAEVRLTSEGRRAQALAGREAMCSRLCALEPDLAALCDLLQGALALAAEPSGFRTIQGRA